MNTVQIVAGIIIALIGVGVIVFSSATEKLAKSGEIPASNLRYVTGFSGKQYPMLQVIGILLIAPGVLMSLLAVVDYYMAVGAAMPG